MAYLGENIPKLGFGFMRLPEIGNEIDIEQTKKMVDLFLSKGFTYFDTAYGYNSGKSEEAIKTTIVDRYPRESFQLATKLPAWSGAKTKEEAQEMFWTSLKRTGAGYFDFYLLHNVSGKHIEIFDDFGIWDFVKELKEKGLVRHYGFSSHANADELDKILRKHPDAEFVQLQINYADWESESVQSRKCYETARRHNKPVIIMEPVKGGSLSALTPEIRAIFSQADPNASPASFAVRFAASLEGVITVLSGMSSIEQVRDNVSYMEHFKPLSDSERKVIDSVNEALNKIPTVPCTSCQYCKKGCPQNVQISEIFSALNQYIVYNNLTPVKRRYGMMTSKGGKASDCIACGNCELVCPQHIEIIDTLKRASSLFD